MASARLARGLGGQVRDAGVAARGAIISAVVSGQELQAQPGGELEPVRPGGEVETEHVQ
jgi:hypothetical protein